MTTTTTIDMASVATALIRAGRLDQADELLAAQPDEPAIAAARAEVAVTRDWYQGTDTAAGALAAAERVVADSGDAAARWDVGFHRMRSRYGTLLYAGSTRLTSADRDPEHTADLRRQATELLVHAPDQRRRGWAEFYLGVMADNIFAEPEVARGHYSAALPIAETTGDAMLEFEALRHLGDHAHDAGDAATAQQQWERSTEAAVRAGAVYGTLAQQLLLAVLARDAGDEAGAMLLTREVSRWAGALGAIRIQAQAEYFLAGNDPTQPPPAIAR